MQIYLWGLALIVAGMVIGALGLYIYMRIRADGRHRAEATRRLDEAINRIGELEGVLAGKRLTENTRAAFEDIGFSEVGQIFQIQSERVRVRAFLAELDQKLELAQFRAQASAQIAAKAIKGPRAYSVDAPSGSRGKPASSL